MEASRELTEYYITNMPRSPTLSQKDQKGADLNLVFKRRLTNEAMMTFYPSLLLIIISYATSYFRLPNFFNTAITVNLTVMLTTTTLLISVVKKLAPTSYIKWIEAWLIFAQLIPFTHVILITCIEWLREAKDKREKEPQEEDEEPEYERSKEAIWLDVGNKLVKVRHNLETPSLHIQVHPLMPFPPKAHSQKSVDVAKILSLIGQLCEEIIFL